MGWIRGYDAVIEAGYWAADWHEDTTGCHFCNRDTEVSPPVNHGPQCPLQVFDQNSLLIPPHNLKHTIRRLVSEIRRVRNGR